LDAKKILGESHYHELGMSGGAYHAFSPDGHLVADRADSGNSRTIYFSDTHTIKTLYTIPVGELSEIAFNRFVENGLAFSADGKTITAIQDYSFIAFLDIETGKTLRILTDHNSWSGMMAFSPDSKRLATSYFAQGLIIWDVKSGKPVEPPLWTDRYSIRELYYAEDDTLYVKGKNREDVLDKTTHWAVEKGDFIPSSTSMIPVAYPVAECNDEGRIIIYDPSAEVPQRVLSRPRCNWPSIWAVSPNTTHVAVAQDGQVIYSDLDSGQQEQIYTYKQGWDIDSIALSNELLAVSGKEGRKSEAVTVIWDLTTGEIIEVLKGQRESITDITFSPDGTILATRSFDGTIVLWPIGEQ
jgi:WD40 repeat protein